MTLDWRDAAYGSKWGYAGRVRLFTVSWALIRDSGKPMILRTELPGYPRQTWPCTDYDEAATTAERVWQEWQKRVGLATGEAAA